MNRLLWLMFLGIMCESCASENFDREMQKEATGENEGYTEEQRAWQQKYELMLQGRISGATQIKLPDQQLPPVSFEEAEMEGLAICLGAQDLLRRQNPGDARKYLGDKEVAEKKARLNALLDQSGRRKHLESSLNRVRLVFAGPGPSNLAIRSFRAKCNNQVAEKPFALDDDGKSDSE